MPKYSEQHCVLRIFWFTQNQTINRLIADLQRLKDDGFGETEIDWKAIFQDQVKHIGYLETFNESAIQLARPFTQEEADEITA